MFIDLYIFWMQQEVCIDILGYLEIATPHSNPFSPGQTVNKVKIVDANPVFISKTMCKRSQEDIF